MLMFVKPALLAMTAAAFMTALSAPAGADADGNYLNILSNTPGFTVNGFTGPLLLGAGNAICGDLRAGVPPEAVVQGRAMAYPGATNVAATQMVAAAQQALCPDTL